MSVAKKLCLLFSAKMDLHAGEFTETQAAKQIYKLTFYKKFPLGLARLIKRFYDQVFLTKCRNLRLLT
jgi:hypothetical protein